jgi:biopolymer transport protein ExbD
MRIHSEPEGNLEFQIAPMVDVIFILILFFMCSAGATKVENELSLKLPGRLSQDQPMRMLDEQIIEIEENGHLALERNPSTLQGDFRRQQILHSNHHPHRQKHEISEDY